MYLVMPRTLQKANKLNCLALSSALLEAVYDVKDVRFQGQIFSCN